MSEPPFAPTMMSLGPLGVAASDISYSAEEATAAMARAPPGLAGLFMSRPAPPNERPPPPPQAQLLEGSTPLVPGLSELGLLGPHAPTSTDPRVPGQPQRQPGRAVGDGRAGRPVGGSAGAPGAPVGPRKDDMMGMRQEVQRQQHFQAKAPGHPGRPVRDAVPTPDRKDHLPVGEAVPRDGSRQSPASGAAATKGGGISGNSGLGKSNDKDVAVAKQANPPHQGRIIEQERRFDASFIERRKNSSDAWDETVEPRAPEPTPAIRPVGAPSPTQAASRSKPAASATVSGSGGTGWEKAQAARSELIRSVFRACDVDGDDWLGEREFRNIASFFGFKGTDDQWSKEFRKLCDENNADPTRGIGPVLFTTLVNDPDGGLQSSNDDLRKMLSKLHTGNKSAPTLNSKVPTSTGDGEGDEFYNKLKRTVNWYNKHGGLQDQIRLNQVAEVLAEIKPGQAMKILFDLDTAKETLPDPTGWIIAEARKRRQANEDGSSNKGKGKGKDDKPANEAKDSKVENKGGAEGGYGNRSKEWRSSTEYQSNTYGANAEGGKGYSKGFNKGTKGKSSDQEPEEEEDEFKSKMRRTINWYNRHGGLLAPINFKEVIAGLGSTDPRVALRILNDLDQANAEAVLNDPTKWILEECRRRVAGDKGMSASPKTSTPGGASDVPMPKPGALSKLGGLTAMPGRLGPPKKSAEPSSP